jgi:hypothetical protein
MREISEADWKVFRDLLPLALERYCRGVLKEVAKACVEDGTGSHDRYLKVYRLIQERDRELADAFNAPRRSAALLQLMHLRRLKLLTEAEFAEFSSETQARVDQWPAA